jgi:hypothetical protein
LKRARDAGPAVTQGIDFGQEIAAGRVTIGGRHQARAARAIAVRSGKSAGN